MLRNAADRIEQGGIDVNDPLPVMDSNGNSMGQFALSVEDRFEVTWKTLSGIMRLRKFTDGEKAELFRAQKAREISVQWVNLKGI